MDVIKTTRGGAYFNGDLTLRKYNSRVRCITFHAMSTGLRLILKNG